jgi:hypothetical protein
VTDPEDRRTAIVAAVVTLGAGLGVRAVTGGVFAKYAGIALYAAFLYTLVVALAPRLTPVRAAAITTAVCWAVELFQLTPVPATLSAHSVLARLALGTTFNWPDLLWYAVGAVALATLHAVYRHRAPR